MMHVQTDVMFL